MRKRSEASGLPEGMESPMREVPGVEEKSSELRAAIEEAEAPVDDGIFDRSLKGIHAGFDRVVSKIFIREEDFEAIYDKLMKLLRSFEGRNELAFWKQNLATVAEAHQLASRLIVTAERMQAAWEADNRLVVAGMRRRAQRLLEQEKGQKSAAKERAKMITDRDVDDCAATEYPTEWVLYASRKSEYELTVKNIKTVIDSINHLSNNLRSLVNGA